MAHLQRIETEKVSPAIRKMRDAYAPYYDMIHARLHLTHEGSLELQRRWEAYVALRDAWLESDEGKKDQEKAWRTS